MLNWGSFVRLLRRKSVLGIIFALSLTYCAISLLSHEKLGKSLRRIRIQGDDDENILSANQDGADNDNIDDPSAKNLAWQLQLENSYDTANEASMDNISSTTDANDTFVSMQVCRNSVQGKALIVDERGFVCPRAELLPTGCCNVTVLETSKDITSNMPLSIHNRKRYSCETCNPQGCCAIYEYCVSCCLQTVKRRGKKDAKVVGDKEQSGNSIGRRSEDAIKLRLRNLDHFQICLAACRTSSASVRHENTYKDPDSKHCYSQYQRHRRDEIYSKHNKGGNPEVVVTSFSTL